MNIKPIGNRILVELKKEEETTISGIILSSDSSKNENTATVIACGNIEENIKIGDKVIFKKNSGEKVEDYLILDIDDVLGIIE